MDRRGLLWFMRERHLVHLRRASGLPPPWTEDEVLATYHFCNIYREIDKVSSWLLEKFYTPLRGSGRVWHAACVARLGSNLPETLSSLGTGEWDRRHFENVLNVRRTAGLPVSRPAAYRIIGGDATGREWVSQLGRRLDVIWSYREDVVTLGRNPWAWYAWLSGFHSVGPFLAYQVTLDLVMAGEVDDAKFIILGPGSERGLERVLPGCVHERPVVDQLHDWLKKRWPKEFPPLSHHVVEQGLCEFDRYHRYKENGHGRPCYSAQGRG